MGKPLILDTATNNKTRPSCDRVKVQVDLLSNFPKSVELEMVNKSLQTAREEKYKVHYDMLPKYCKTCKLQGHNEKNRRVLFPELRRSDLDNDKWKQAGEENNKEATKVPIHLIRFGRQFMKCHPTNKSFPKKTHNDMEDMESGEIEEGICSANALEALKGENCTNT